MIFNKFSYAVPEQKMVRVITNTDAKMKLMISTQLFILF